VVGRGRGGSLMLAAGVHRCGYGIKTMQVYQEAMSLLKGL
jgi:hypothetical protein